MAGDWRETTLGQLGAFRNGINFDRTQEGLGLAVLKVKDFKDRFFAPESGYDELDPVSLQATNAQFLSEGDTVIIRSNGNPQLVGRSVYIRHFAHPITFSGFCIRFRPDRSTIDPRFAAYLIRSPFFRQRFTAYGSGTGIQNLSQDILGAVPVRLPELPEQRAIAHILGALDDKIELNRQMNETLEAMAQALFKSWFVDFDPVRAKAEGWDPGLPKHVADLFPNTFEESELGEVPRQWEVRGLDEIARFINGLALQKYPPAEGNSLPVVKIAQLRTGNTNGADQASADLGADYIAQDGDILFSWSGSLECVLWTGGRGALNQHLFKVSPKGYPRWFCYLGVHEHLDEFRNIAAGKATTMGHIQRHHLSDAKLAVPSPAVLQAMDRIFQPLFESTWQRAVQSRTLTTLRDTLLPKLISGELRIKDAERFLADKGYDL